MDEIKKEELYEEFWEMFEFTKEEFDRELKKMVARDAKMILSIPGVYELVSKKYRNKILKVLEERNERLIFSSSFPPGWRKREGR